nr:MAG TPA: hypothetical protein [Caudoviricetes sp.]
MISGANIHIIYYNLISPYKNISYYILLTVILLSII